MKESTCIKCGSKFKHFPCRPRKFCSKNCSSTYLNANRIWSQESKNKIALANNKCGEDNPNWKGGGTDFICQLCGLPFKVPINALTSKKHLGLFCSRICRNTNKTVNAIPLHQKKLHALMRGNVSRCIKEKKAWRKWTQLVGYTAEELATHLEAQFTEGMTWEKYPLWHIDHITPVSLFRFNSFDDPEFKKCWALDNLQPLWAEDNIKKGNKIL